MKKYLKNSEEYFNTSEKQYKIIRDSTIPSVQDIDDFVDSLNSILVESKVSEIFQSKFNEYNNMFGRKENEIVPDA